MGGGECIESRVAVQAAGALEPEMSSRPPPTRGPRTRTRSSSPGAEEASEGNAVTRARRARAGRDPGAIVGAEEPARIGRDARRATTRPGTAARVDGDEIVPSETRERERHVQRATRDAHAIAGDETRAPREPFRAGPRGRPDARARGRG